MNDAIRHHAVDAHRRQHEPDNREEAEQHRARVRRPVGAELRHLDRAALPEHVHLPIRALHRNTRLEPCDYPQESARPVAIGCPETDRRPDLHRREEPEAVRHDAEDRVLRAGETEGLANGARPSTESLLPEVVADHRDTRCGGHILGNRERSPESRLYPENREDLRRRSPHLDRHRVVAGPRKGRWRIDPCGHRLERSRRVPPGQKVRRARRVTELLTAQVVLPEQHEPLGIAIWQLS